MQLQNENNILSDTKDDFDLGQIFRILLMQSKLIALFMFFGIAIGVTSYLTTEKQYRVISLIQVFEEAPSGKSDLDLFTQSSNTSNLNNVGELYKSRSNILDIIKANNLNIKSDKLTFSQIKNIKNLEFKPFTRKTIDLSIVFFEDNFEIFDVERKPIGSFEYDKLHSIGNLIIEMPIFDDVNFGEEYDLTIQDPVSIFESERARFSINKIETGRSSLFSSTGLLKVSYTSSNIDNAIDILNFSNSLFIINSIETESEKARKAIDFLDQRINSVQAELDNEKGKLRKFKESNQSVDVDLETQTIIERITSIEEKINQIDLEISSASSIYTSTNPIFLELTNQKQTLLNQKNSIENQIRNLPIAQQEYIDLFRDLEISQDVYSELLNRKLEFSIKEASTLGNIRIVDNAYLDQKVSPQLNLVFFYIILFTVTALFIAIFRGLFLIPISNPAELRDRKINTPIAGVIPEVEEYLESFEDNEKLNQSLESLTVNIKAMISDDNNTKNNHTILVTSPTSGNGKTFVTRKLAEKMAQLNNKVLLLDIDWKRGDQHKYAEKSTITLEDFKKIDEESLEKNYKQDNGLYLIPRISKLNNSFQFLYSPDFDKKLSELKGLFDYIIIDTAPLLSVSDTSILLSYSDINLAIVKHGLTK